MAIGNVSNKFKQPHRGIGETVNEVTAQSMWQAFCNPV